MNPFESAERKVIPAVLLYVREGGETLMIHKGYGAGGDSRDGHAGKCNGLGGKLEADESPLEGAVREFREEAGIEVPAGAFRSLGVLQFPLFKPHKREDWLVYLFEVRLDSGQRARVPSECPEGALRWVRDSEVMNLPLWDGDVLFLPHVLRGEPILGTLWYREGKVARHWIEPIRSPL